MANFSGLKRIDVFREMEQKEYDLLIIGGGITGAGIALDAITRGLKVALVERNDFASGTSSRSTKLVHGGLRYLKQFEIKEVTELGKERAIVYENGPHVTTPEWMLLPFHKGGTFGKFTTSIGLMVYDFLAGVKKSERRRMLSVNETLDKVPFIKKTGLKGSGYYVEYRTDDARLTIEVMKAAVQKGATLLNYAKADKFLYNDQGKIIGVEVQDQLGSKRVTVKANKIVNATGPWVDELRNMDGSKTEKHLRLSKGVHIVFDESVFPLHQAVYFDTPDGRMVFAIPRGGKTYVGTTDTFYEGDPANIYATQEDRDYLLKAILYMFPDLSVSDSQIESSWAGVRPLIHEEGKAPSEISRKDEIWESNSGLITIAGGKLTGYRKMAETVVNVVVDQLSQAGAGVFDTCQTKHLPISGGDLGGSAKLDTFILDKGKEAENYGLTQEEGQKLAKLYGANVDTVFGYVPKQKGELPATMYAQLLYAIHHEMTVQPVDFFIRRTGELLFDIQKVHQWKDTVIKEMAHIFNWTEEEQKMAEEALNKELNHAAFSRGGVTNHLI
ncbi:glycerol-3-phosphate dehydrogenase/oxidase [Lederbergia sp. NSJ-179]|uniref:glycerol-3-phosphate dehydrogenase/oxidase n=1 Tax=Lederbergia sp. NSJ-179 TaxID=2931402 RepID=UPI001FD6018E|nr:glycerol-3-phosphate dehydrogenase/oxidase [Lederbergia sp. NSJ-179]MCJ7843524.1 glycerol-3-phosphate dehydrogenase/oxidase [Lederbergia sp. NSJ-179]